MRESPDGTGSGAGTVNAQSSEQRAAAPPIAESTEQCAKLIDELLLARRNSEAQQQFRRCAQRFPDHVWPSVWRERLGLIEAGKD
jgi:hypothetical protein